MLLDIVFQSGEFYGSDSSSISKFLPPFIATTTAVGLFYLGTLRDKKKERIAHSKKQANKLNYFASLIKSIIKIGKEQVKGTKDFETSLSENITIIPLLNSLAIDDLKRFVHKLDQAEYHEAYIHKFGSGIVTVEKFRKIYQCCDSLNAMITQMYDVLEKSHNFDWERKKEFKSFFEKSMQESGKIIVSAKLKEEKELVNLLNNSFKTFLENQDDPSDITYIYESFVKPVKSEIAKDFTHIPEAIDVANLLLNANYIYSQIIFSNETLLEDFKAYSENLNDIIINLEELTEDLLSDFEREDTQTVI